MATYCMISKKFHQKYLLVLIDYPPEWILRQFIYMLNFLIFFVFFLFFLLLKDVNGCSNIRIPFEYSNTISEFEYSYFLLVPAVCFF